MAEFRARQEVEAAVFNVPEAYQTENEAFRDTIEAAAKPPVAPVVELHGGRAHVRTVENSKVTLNPHQKNYEPNAVELAPESEALFRAALDIMKARAEMTDMLLSRQIFQMMPILGL
ncbi:MAG TPA: hypothetical protein VFZ58_00375 [Candidatus Saccharimonadales bacterium]